MDAVLNWLWQGGLVGLAAAVLLRATPRCPARTRYSVVWAACIVILAVPCVPFLLADLSFRLPTQIPAARELTTSGLAISIPAGWWTSGTLAVGLWSAWAVVCTVQFAVAARALRRTRNACRPVAHRIEANLPHWSRVKTAGRQACLVLSTRVRSAAVLGCGPPVIALAPALLEHLQDDDVDRVVIHEWAHVQRRDDLAQYLQFIVRLVAGWHPAVWWLQRQLDAEREVACDEAAVAATGSAKAYALCLTKVATLPVCSTTFAALAVSSSGLGRRVIRILAMRPGGHSIPAYGLAAGSAVMFVALALAVGSVRVVTTAATLMSVGAMRQIAEMPMTGDGVTASAPVIIESPAADPMIARRPPAPRERMRPATDKTALLPMAPAEMAVTATLPTPTTADLPPSLEPQQPVDSMAAGPVEQAVDAADADAPAGAVTTVTAAVPEDQQLQRDSAGVRGAWTAAAEAGAAIGRRSQTAGVATAALFNRFGVKIAASF